MAFFELKDGFSQNSRQYVLITTVEIEKKAIKFVYFRQGNAIFSFVRSFQPALNDDQIKQLASKVHEFYKREIAKLFQLANKLRQSAIQDTSMDLLARGFLKYGMASEAIALLDPLVQKSRDFPQSQFTLGKALISVKKYKAARKHFLHLLSGQRRYADSHFYLGLCEYNLRDCTAAFHAFAKAIEINSHYGEAYYYLGLTLLLNAILDQQKDLTHDLCGRAKKVFLSAVKNMPELKVKQAQQGLMLIERKDFHKAYD
ncbi:MAG: tetratricopeptide repeat protein, partial [bacterium]